jgi:hypothetical protein
MHGCGGSVSGYVSVYCLGHRQRKYRICVDSFSTSHSRCALSSIFSSFTKSDNDAAAWSTRGHRGGGETWALSYASHRNCSAATAVKSGLGKTREGSFRGGGVILAMPHCTVGGSCSEVIFALYRCSAASTATPCSPQSLHPTYATTGSETRTGPSLYSVSTVSKTKEIASGSVRSRWRSRVPSA